jgi:hypothetical protein
VNFSLGSVQGPPTWDTAYGNVTGGVLERGAFVTMQLVDGGKGMTFGAGGGDSNFPFCKYVGGSYVTTAGRDEEPGSEATLVAVLGLRCRGYCHPLIHLDLALGGGAMKGTEKPM